MFFSGNKGRKTRKEGAGMKATQIIECLDCKKRFVVREYELGQACSVCGSLRVEWVGDRIATLTEKEEK